MAVVPELGGRGIGRALLRRCTASLEQAGARQLVLTVEPANAPARSLYESEGFVWERTDPAFFGPGAPRLVMRRSIDGRG